MAAVEAKNRYFRENFFTGTRSVTKTLKNGLF
jgi:hypothetical protein